MFTTQDMEYMLTWTSSKSTSQEAEYVQQDQIFSSGPPREDDGIL